jgi:60 kDa SS-A/Ro ribonucleoprotein
MAKRIPSQFESIKGRESEMTQNSNGAFVFAVDDWKQLERFLVLGSDKGTYYISAAKLTRDNAMAVLRCLDVDGVKTVNIIAEISEAGRAVKNEPALFALALASSHTNPAVRKAAFDALPRVARTATHLFTFAEYMQSFRGWGKAARRAIASWYTEKDTKALAYQLIKYQNRDGWAHRDLMRLAHPVAKDNAQEALFRWAVSGYEGLSDTNRKVRRTVEYGGVKGHEIVNLERPALVGYLHEQVEAFEQMKALKVDEVAKAVDLINRYDLPREAVSTHFLTNPDIWVALLNRMPMTAAVRNLGVMTKNGVFNIKSAKDKVLDMLSNEEHLKRSRIHPMQVLIALKTYANGGGMRSKSTWTVDRDISSSLDGAFYKTFKNVTPTGKRQLIALDVSGSMAGTNTTSIEGLSAREVTAAVALVTMSVEDNVSIVGFQDKVTELKITPKMDLPAVLRVISNLDFGSTDCAAPFAWAKQHKKEFDAFSVYTDNETGSGSYWGHRPSSQPSEALKAYRKSTGIPAKLAVVATAANNFSIADPTDAGMMDVCGFDGSVPAVLADFFRG